MNVEKLKKSGIDYDDGLSRFSGNVALYEKYLQRLPSLTLYDEMKAAIDVGDIQAAFEASHKLKAFVGNLSMNHFHEKLVVLTNIFREGNCRGTEPLIKELDAEYALIIAAIGGEEIE